MKVEVFNYRWTAYNVATDERETRASEGKVTREFVADREVMNPDVTYVLLERTGEEVEASAVKNGRYHPEVVRRGFQRQVR